LSFARNQLQNNFASEPAAPSPAERLRGKCLPGKWLCTRQSGMLKTPGLSDPVLELKRDCPSAGDPPGPSQPTAFNQPREGVEPGSREPRKADPEGPQ